MIALYIIGLAFLAVFTFDLAMVITEIVVK